MAIAGTENPLNQAADENLGTALSAGHGFTHRRCAVHPFRRPGGDARLEFGSCAGCCALGQLPFRLRTP